MRIKKLPENVINQIAAGEVVERPSSVLKELIENSLDANADRVEIKIEKGGKKLIEVKDNGTGIHPDDILESVRRFSTSKISDIEDLYSVSSYGFRGEALASISSVSKFSILSRQSEFPLGKELYIEGGKFKHLTDAGAPVGTTVRVRDIFFNVPAREKFLKSENTEKKHIIDTFIKYALFHNDKAFILKIDGKSVFSLTPSDTEERILSIFPKIESLNYFENENKIGRIRGYYSQDITGRGFIFINGRPVKNSTIKRIIRSKLGENFFVAFIDLPPYYIDFNVHPAKTEVKFKKDKPVHQLVKTAFEKPQTPFSWNISQISERYGATFEILGQIENTFIVVYYDGYVYFIDQHIASERVNYELFLRKFRSGRSEQKDADIFINADNTLKTKIFEISDLLHKAGFGIEIIKEGLIINKIPSFLKEEKVKDIILKLLESDIPEIELESMLADTACSVSVEAGEVLNEEEAKSILRSWIQTDNPNLCPHGRPIYYKISVETIKKKVGRK